MSPGVTGLTRGTLGSAPSVCRECVWWQSRGNRTASKERWIDRAEEEWGEWGTIYLDDDGRLLGSMQYGPSHLFPRAADLPAGPPSDDAVLVTCTYLIGDGAEWVEKSLLLAAIGESRDQGASALEAFAYRYPPGRDGGGALPRPPHGVPARLPRGVRLRDAPRPGARRALPARARRVSCRSRRVDARRCCASCRRRSRRRPRPFRGRSGAQRQRRRAGVRERPAPTPAGSASRSRAAQREPEDTERLGLAHDAPRVAGRTVG